MTIQPVTDHVERGLSRLIEQFKNKPRVASLIKSYLLQVQELSDATWEVLVSRLIDDATDEQLTVLSRLVGESVRLDDDERQRVLVRARIAVNRSNGHGDDVLRVASLLFQRPFQLVELFPGSMIVTVLEPVSAVPGLERRMLEQAAAAGVRLDVHFSEDEESEWFTWSTGPGWGVGAWVGTVA